MKLSLFRLKPGQTFERLYGAIVAQARHPALYRIMGVPDTLEGRFEMVVLHLALVLNRLAREGAAAREAGQGAFDLFCSDMDDHMREMGVGDLKVPKVVRRVADAYYSRQLAYQAAYGDAGKWEDALMRNVFAGDPERDAGILAAYAMAAARKLDTQDAQAIAAGEPAWPLPAMD